jgi:thiol-disulfide isomerase/thioredoxin
MRKLIITATILALAGFATAQDSEPKAKNLTVGDVAPAVKVDTWVKGKPIESFSDGSVYVMEFWATWCGPCIRGIPHLTELQKEYMDKDVTIVGTAIWQREETQKDRVDVVSTFVESQGDKMNYTIAVDDGSSMSDSWMRPAGRNGIPSAFIVGKDAHIEWIGHPMSMDEPLEQIVNGTWDREAFAAAFKKEQEQEKAMRTLMTDVRSAETPAEVKAVVGKIDAVLADDPSNLNLHMMKYDLLLKKLNDQQAAADCGEAVAKANWDSSGLLNAMSWNTITAEGINERLMKLATEWAKQADALTDHSDASIIDTLARCYFVQGDVQLAIETQKKAIEASDPGSVKNLKDTLDEYEATLDKA